MEFKDMNAEQRKAFFAEQGAKSAHVRAKNTDDAIKSAKDSVCGNRPQVDHDGDEDIIDYLVKEKPGLTIIVAAVGSAAALKYPKEVKHAITTLLSAFK